MALPGKPAWHSMLRYADALHERNAPQERAPWAMLHRALDRVTSAPAEAADRLRELSATHSTVPSEPDLWPLAVELLGDSALIQELAPALCAQLDQAVDSNPAHRNSLATLAYQFARYDAAARWTAEARYARARESLRSSLQDRFDPQIGWFQEPGTGSALTIGGMWPLAVGAATDEQAWSVLQSLLNPERFFAPHPLRTVVASEPQPSPTREPGPAGNALVFWAAGGCVQLGHPEAARRLLEGALDHSALWFERTGTIWEFYDPEGGDPRSIGSLGPEPDSLANNPLSAMAVLWEECQE